MILRLPWILFCAPSSSYRPLIRFRSSLDHTTTTSKILHFPSVFKRIQKTPFYQNKHVFQRRMATEDKSEHSSREETCDDPVLTTQRRSSSRRPVASTRDREEAKATKRPKSAAGKRKDSADEVASETERKAPKKKKAPPHQVLTDRDEIPKLWDSKKAAENGSYTFKIASWNVAGLRAILKKTPHVMRELVDRHDLDVLCLQETKLQENHLTDGKLKIREILGITDDYDDIWSCSTAKKGYSGTAVFVRKRGEPTSNTKAAKQTTLKSFAAPKAVVADQTKDKKTSLPIDEQLLIPTQVSYGIAKSEHDSEGRTITVQFPRFSFCNVYVPNSGQKLERLSYRTEQWDRDFLSYMKTLAQKTKKPVIWLGDLNVAHTKLEVWNDGAKHLAKQAGVTEEERASFQQQLDSGFIDAFRRLHPQAAGHYSYWSTRAGNRIPNKGLRLDYFICDPDLFKEDSTVMVRDSYMDFDQMGSDHCPIILELEIRE